MHKYRFSSITLYILFINVGTVFILGFGLLYTGQHEQQMVRGALQALKIEARMISTSLEENARKTGKGITLPKHLPKNMLFRLAEDRRTVILFDKNSRVVLDNRKMSAVPAPLPKRNAEFLEKLLVFLPTRVTLPPWPNINPWPQLKIALNGNNVSGAYRDEEGRIILATAVPVKGKTKQSKEEIIGAVLMMRGGGNIDKIIQETQLSIVQLFLWVLLSSVLLSLYLSETIAAPLLQIAQAARKARESLTLKGFLPNLSYRKDEIGILSEALTEMTEDFSARIEAVGSFAADVAHEIKNPLASLRSATETLAVVQDEKQRRKLLSIITHDVSRINRLVTDISMASRLDSEIGDAPRGVFDLAPLLQGVAKAAADSRIRVDIDPVRKLRINGNAAQMEQVLHNIVLNAVSFVDKDGNIDIAGKISEGKIILHIDNDGPPIPERKLEAIFERFYSERPESEEFGLHSGLGLSISRQIIRAHGGVIFAENLKNALGVYRGVRFTIILPAAGAT